MQWSSLFHFNFYYFDISAETGKSLPLPIPTMTNSTAISVKLPTTPYLPPTDNWTYVQNHEVLYHRSGVQETPQKLTISGALPQTVVATGLKKYTDYVFYAHYFGTINTEDQNIISGYSMIVKTDEDGTMNILQSIIYGNAFIIIITIFHFSHHNSQHPLSSINSIMHKVIVVIIAFITLQLHHF